MLRTTSQLHPQGHDRPEHNPHYMITHPRMTVLPIILAPPSLNDALQNVWAVLTHACGMVPVLQSYGANRGRTGV